MGFSAFTMDDYTITPEGDVINNRWNRKVKPQLNDKGYLRVGICGKLRFVHRLVAEKYVPNPDNKPQVNHKDGNKLNNRADNLEWVTNQENRDHALSKGLHIHGEACPWAKLTQTEVDFIRQNPDIDSVAYSIILGVTPNHINSIKRGACWK